MSGDGVSPGAVEDTGGAAQPMHEDGETVPGVADLRERPKAVKIVHPKRDARRRPSSSPAIFPLNLLAGLLGLMSLAFAWNYVAWYGGLDAFTVFRYIVDVGEYSTMYSAIVLLVLAGSVLCFITSLGGILQLAGVLLYAFEFASDPGIAGPGPFVAIAAAVAGTGSILLSPRLEVPSRFASFVRGDKGVLSVNVLALSAFVLGLLSIIMIWLVVDQRLYNWGPDLPNMNYSLLAFMCDARFDDLSLVIVGAALMSVGSVMCLLTPFGSLLQAVGTGLCFLEMSSSFGDWTSAMGSTDVRLGEGLYLAVVAAAAGVWSMVFVRRVDIPGKFVSSLLVPECARAEQVAPKASAEDSGCRPPCVQSIISRIPRAARVPFALAVTLAVILAFMAVPYAAQLTTVQVAVSNSSTVNVEADVYIDGVLVSSGTVTPYFAFICESRVTAGVHTVSLDYAYSSDDSPHPDGDTDWSSSVDVDPYMTSTVNVLLMGVHDTNLPEVTLSCEPTSDGYVITFEEVVEYNWVGEQFTDIDWSALSLVLVEGFGPGVGWSFSTDELDEFPYAQEDCGIAYLGALTLNCTAFDISGDGEASAGDFVRLTVIEGEFSASSEYIAYMLYEPYDSVVGSVAVPV